MDPSDWRDQMQPETRKRNVNKIIETLKRHHPLSDQDELLELQKGAQRFEETTYATAASQSDYLQKISLKMLPMEVASDWRAQLQPDSRQRIVSKILEILRRHLPVSGPEGLQELRKISQRFEERVYTASTSQSDYLRNISLKMLTMEAKNNMANSMPSNLGDNSSGPSHTGLVMQSQDQNQEQPVP